MRPPSPRHPAPIPCCCTRKTSLLRWDERRASGELCAQLPLCDPLGRAGPNRSVSGSCKTRFFPYLFGFWSPSNTSRYNYQLTELPGALRVFSQVRLPPLCHQPRRLPEKRLRQPLPLPSLPSAAQSAATQPQLSARRLFAPGTDPLCSPLRCSLQEAQIGGRAARRGQLSCTASRSAGGTRRTPCFSPSVALGEVSPLRNPQAGNVSVSISVPPAPLSPAPPLRPVPARSGRGAAGERCCRSAHGAPRALQPRCPLRAASRPSHARVGFPPPGSPQSLTRRTPQPPALSPLRTHYL